jgi:hypothetical protein
MVPNQIEVIKPIVTKKFKSFCGMVQRKFKRDFIQNDTLDLKKLMVILIDLLTPKKDLQFVHHKKYTTNDFVNGIFDMIDNGSYWNRYKGLISGKYLNRKHNEYCKLGVYHCLYRLVLLNYFSTHKFNKLQYQSVDSSFLTNLYGKDIYGRNVKYKSKNGLKVSTITDRNGVPFNIAIGGGNEHDLKIAKKQIGNSYYDAETERVAYNNKYKQTLFGDSAYHDNELRNRLMAKGYTVITDVNIRNTKCPKKLKILERQKAIYLKNCRKRFIVESSYSWMKKFPKLERVIEKTSSSFIGLLLLGSSITASRKYNKEKIRNRTK